MSQKIEVSPPRVAQSIGGPRGSREGGRFNNAALESVVAARRASEGVSRPSLNEMQSKNLGVSGR